MPKRLRLAVTGVSIVVLVLGLTTVGLAQNNASTTIVGTAHDFTTYSWWDGTTGGVDHSPTGADENHCAVCHGPPEFNPGTATSAPVWNHKPSTAGPYTLSSALSSQVTDLGQPSAISQKCLDCHDGTENIDAFDPAGGTSYYAGSVAMTGDANFSTNLVVHHPVSFTYNTGYTVDMGDSVGPGLTVDLGNIILQDPAVADSRLGGTVAEILLKSNKIECTTCHEQHNDLAFENEGGDPNDDPGDGDFVVLDRLCFKCHEHDQPDGGHHIPRRDDPLGLERGSSFNCTECHGNNLEGKYGGHIPACDSCHNSWDPTAADTDSPTGYAQAPLGHHGGDRTKPYFDCAVCHADPLTGVVTGNDFGTLQAPSCYECHDDMWNEAGNTAPTLPSLPDLDGTVNEAVTVDVSGTVDADGDPLAFEWDWGDGSQPQMPTRDQVVSHTYDDTGTFTVTVAVTDGTHAPVTTSFDVTVASATGETGPDTWDVAVAPDTLPTVTFTETFEDRNGSLVGTKDDGTLAFGIEFVGVIFWMDLWMDLSGNTYWGTGDMYFANIDREAGTMAGVKFGEDGTVGTFAGAKQ